MLVVADVEIVRKTVSLDYLRGLAEGKFGDLVKAVVDVERGIMAIAGDLHGDEEAILLDDGSSQANLWGINLYPADYGEAGWVEFDSMINVRPSSGNRSREVEDTATAEKILEIVGRLVEP